MKIKVFVLVLILLQFDTMSGNGFVRPDVSGNLWPDASTLFVLNPASASESAPVIAMNIGNSCEDASTSFTAELISGCPVIQWHWDFGDGDSAVGTQVFHEYGTAGSYEVTLTATGDGDCQTTLVQTIIVHSKPEVSFATSLLCKDIPILFTDNSTTSEGTIENSTWLIGSNFYTGQSAEVIFPVSGPSSVVHIVQNSMGCSAEVSMLVDVNAPPTVNWIAESACLGSLTSFTAQVADTEFPIASYSWDLGNGVFSELENPNHYYSKAGNYNVNLMATNSFGCSESHNSNLEIFALPVADFLIINACQGQKFSLTDQSQSTAGDPIVEWTWTIENEIILLEQNPEFTFNTIGLTPVQLTVMTENGCQQTTQQQIPVWPVPQAEYSFDPLIGEAPVEIHFTNLSQNITQSKWFFGDTYSSEENSPAHTFTLNGTFYTQLIAINQYGCADTIGKIITIAEPVLDIRVRSMSFMNNGPGTEISCELVNMGNITIDELVLTWQVGNDAPVKEVLMEPILPGETYIYTFNSLMQQVGNQYHYLCVSAEPVNAVYREINFTDNSICKPLKNGELEVFPPFPNPGDDRMFIRFVTPVAGDLNLKVFNTAGNLVIELADMDVPEGFHQYFMDISSLQNGNYVLHLQLGSRETSVSFMKLKR